MSATFAGVHQHDARLPDWSPAALADELKVLKAMRDVLADAGETPSPDRELARANVDVRIAEHESNFFHSLNPALWTGEAIFAVVSLMIRDFAPAAQRAGHMIDRFNAIPRFLTAMRASITRAVAPHWVARAARECNAALGLFDAGLRGWMGEQQLDAGLQQQLLDAAERARDAFTVTAAELAAIPSAGAHYAVGADVFGTLLRRGHFCADSAEPLLEEALAALPIEQQRLAEMCAASQYGSWAAVQAALAADHPSVKNYYATFERRWNDCHRIAHEHDAVTWPDWPIRYVPIPEWAAPYAPQLYWLFYRSPAPFDPYTTYDYVVTPIDASLRADESEKKLRAWNHSTITLNHVVHHGAVGHHVQNWHARHQTRSRIGQVAATDCASRIAMFLGGSMAEGWACYATQLMEELGMLTELERLSEQHTRIRMLARAIVDIRLHHGRCTFDEAVQYYQDVVGMPLDVATAETTKNSMFPCTAIMYWLGTSRILALRERMKAARGHAFVLREFHDELLGYGAIPVLLVATLMMESAA